MRVWVQIPCLEAETVIASAIHAVPHRIDSAGEVTVLVIDDGSRDRTAEAARRAGVDHVVRLPHPQGSARAFAAGLNYCLEHGADVIVNIDADHTCPPADLARLVQPVLDSTADIVIAHRVKNGRADPRLVQRTLRTLGSRTLSVLANVDVPDASSGVRAYSREAALKLNVLSTWAYTLDTLVQAGKKDLVVTHVPVALGEVTPRRQPRAGLRTYLKRSIATLLRVYALYEPLRTFFYVGAAIFVLGLAGFGRFLYFWLHGAGTGHIQSLTISGVLLIIAFQLWMLGILADVLSVNRRLTEDILCRLKREDLNGSAAGGGPAFRSPADS